MNPIPLIMAALFLAMVFSVESFNYLDTKQNAEFEAKNCPEMLQVDSSYCKPTKGDDQ